MLYKISKLVGDGRAQGNGYVLPDGYYRLVEGTMYNAAPLKGVEKDGWVVEEYEPAKGAPTEPGLYCESDDTAVDQWSALTAAMSPNKIEVEAPAPGYLDPGVFVGMSPEQKAKKSGRKAPMLNPVQADRARRLRAQAAETVAEMQGRTKAPVFTMA